MSPRYYNDYTPRPTAVVYQLRKQGEIDQAHQHAANLYRNNPNDGDIQKAYAWTLIDLCKREYTNGNIAAAQEWLNKVSLIEFDCYHDEFVETIKKQIRSLQTKLDPHADIVRQASELSRAGDNNQAYTLLTRLHNEGNLSSHSHESYGWIIYRYLKDNVNNLTSTQVRAILLSYIRLSNERPSNLHSQILNFALNYSRNDTEFKLIPFLRMWNPENLTYDDFRDSIAQDGKRIPSLMSRIAREVVRYSSNDVIEFLECIPNHKERFIELLREAYFWIIYNSFSEQRSNDAWSQLAAYNTLYAQFGPSDFHSKILGLAERHTKEDNQSQFYNFFYGWNPINLREEDWKEEVGNNGDTYKPLAMKCLKKSFDSLGEQNANGEVDLTWLINAYKIAVSKFPDDEWTIRSLGKLYYRAGNLADAEKIYKDLSLMIGDKYYIWDEFASCIEDINVKIGMLCKAISLERNEDFIGKIRVDLAEQLIRINKHEAAALEIKLHKEHYTSKGWNVKPRVLSLEAKCGHITTMPDDNKALYSELIPYAEEFAYSDIPFTNLVLIDDWKNEDGKKFQKYVDGQHLEVVINIRRFPQLKNAKLGQVWQFKLYKDPSTNKHQPLLAKQSQLANWSILPECYGYVNNVNEERKVYHIYTQSSDPVSYKYTDKHLSKGDFVNFRVYRYIAKGEVRINIYNLTKVNKDEALHKFPTSIVAVDGVNNEKQLFHFVQSSNYPAGVIHYNQTELRPAVGDFLRIYFYIRKRKEVRRVGEDPRITEVIHVETTSEVNTNLIKEHTGRLEVKYHGGINDDYWDDYNEDETPCNVLPDFAFIGDYYVPKGLLRQHNITADCQVKYKALSEGNGKWKVFWLEIL